MPVEEEELLIVVVVRDPYWKQRVVAMCHDVGITDVADRFTVMNLKRTDYGPEVETIDLEVVSTTVDAA